MTALHSRPAVAQPHRSGPASVPLRIVPSRRAPRPLPAAGDLAESGEPTTGRLMVDASRSPLSPHLRGRRLAVVVDGQPRWCGWGRTPIDLPPGRHLVEIEVEHAGGWGPVADAVPVAAGHTVEVFYRAPALPRVAGALGPSPQGTRGGTVLVAAALLLLTTLVALLVGFTGLL